MFFQRIQEELNDFEAHWGNHLTYERWFSNT